MMCETGPIQKTYELNGNASLCDSLCQHHQLHKCRFKIPKVNISQVLKWKETAFMKISSNFRAVMRHLVRSNSFLLSFLKAWKVTITAKAWLKIVNGLAFIWIWILPYNQKRAGRKEEKIIYSPSCMGSYFLWSFPTFSCQAVIFPVASFQDMLELQNFRKNL